MCADPADGAQTLHRAIHHMNDGQVFMMGERLKLNIRTDRFAMRDRLERYLRRVCFGSDAAPWYPTRDEQVFAHDSMQETLLFEERVRFEIATLSAHIAGNKLLQPRQMDSQNREKYFLCDQIVGFFSSIWIDIGEPCTSGGISDSGCSAIATASDELLVRRVSIVAPMNFHEAGESVHQTKEQSTRVPLRFRQADEYYSTRENSVALCGTVYDRQSIPPRSSAVAERVGSNSILNSIRVVAEITLLPQRVIGEVDLPRSNQLAQNSDVASAEDLCLCLSSSSNESRTLSVGNRCTFDRAKMFFMLNKKHI